MDTLKGTTPNLDRALSISAPVSIAAICADAFVFVTGIFGAYLTTLPGILMALVVGLIVTTGGAVFGIFGLWFGFLKWLADRLTGGVDPPWLILALPALAFGLISGPVCLFCWLHQ
jgi:hypothetical protein